MVLLYTHTTHGEVPKAPQPSFRNFGEQSLDASEDIVLASRRDQSRRLADRRRHSMVGRKLHRSSADGSQPPSRRHSIQPVSRSTTPPFSSPSRFFFSLSLSLSPSLSHSEGCTRSSAGAGEINHARNLSRSRQKISSAVGLGSNERANDGVMDNRRDLSIGRDVLQQQRVVRVGSQHER